MKRFLPALLAILCTPGAFAQSPVSYSSADVLQRLKKLEVFGAVLYIAAHPDDENTRLLAYLANERKLRTGYLSLTRGDGGQNLIGDEQGVELGLIRTQELLAARRKDGAEQFFTRAFDFGYSKSPEETLKKWGHDKVLSDVVWVIRKFRPDVIVTRFPTTGEGGHGHHTASAILAGEAFDAAGNPAMFPEQLKNGVAVWQPKRLMWNSFNFGGANTQREDQLKMDVGMYNAILGKSYGELAAESRSQHKSQGFGVPAQRGESFEYFSLIKGSKPQTDIMEGVELSSRKIGEPGFTLALQKLLSEFKAAAPVASLPLLLSLRKKVSGYGKTYWQEQKLKEINQLAEAMSGIFMEAVAPSPYAVQGDSVPVAFYFNNRLGVVVNNISVQLLGSRASLKPAAKNTNAVSNQLVWIPANANLSQPYWLKEGMPNGSFTVTTQELIGVPWNDGLTATFSFEMEGEQFLLSRPVQFKSTDPVKGEIYQPVSVVPTITMHAEPAISLFATTDHSGKPYTKQYRLFTDGNKIQNSELSAQVLTDAKAGTTLKKEDVAFPKPASAAGGAVENILKDGAGSPYYELREIQYDHIPAIRYFKPATQQIIQADFSIAGKTIGYIAGAGDKVPQALTQMGYKVVMLNENDITPANLKQFDALVTGVRAYNTNLWLAQVSGVLNNYVKEGGVMLVQYNTNNNAGPLRQKMGPYPFTLGRSRITDETADVKFLIPNDPLLNYPNKITAKDFTGWVQERSVYHAENADGNYRKILSMKDPGENESDGSLIAADYGKGRFIYTGLVFFRQLPAGVPGAYRLLANLLAAPQNINATGKK